MRAVVLLFLCAALAACGSSAHPVASTGTVPAATPSGPATSSPSGATTATTPAVTVAPEATTPTAEAPGTLTHAQPSTGRCTAPVLALSVLSSQGAAGHGVLALALRNTGPASCHTYGFPGVAFLGPGGRLLADIPRRVTTDFVGPVPVRALALAPGQSASFRVVVSHGSAAPGSCTTATGIQVIAPDDTRTLRVGLAGVTECGAVTVSPLQAGLGANPA
jgi:hypothetical protein